MHRDAPTCGLYDPVGEVRARLLAGGWDLCPVLNEARVVLGRLRLERLGGLDPATPAEQVMEAGPSTYRPSVGVEEMLDRMRRRSFELAFITDPDGRFLGIARKSDLERLAA